MATITWPPMSSATNFHYANQASTPPIPRYSPNHLMLPSPRDPPKIENLTTHTSDLPEKIWMPELSDNAQEEGGIIARFRPRPSRPLRMPSLVGQEVVPRKSTLALRPRRSSSQHSRENYDTSNKDYQYLSTLKTPPSGNHWHSE